MLHLKQSIPIFINLYLRRYHDYYFTLIKVSQLPFINYDFYHIEEEQLIIFTLVF